MLGLLKRANGADAGEIKRRDLRDYLFNQGIQLKKNGNGWVALCPLHEETNPSFHVSEKEGIWLWHCFGCNRGGTVIDYVMAKEGLDVKGALERLNESNGSFGRRAIPDARTTNNILHLKLLEQVAKHYTHQFAEDARARDYLAEARGIKDPKLYETFRIGFSNNTLFKTIPSQGAIVDGLKEVGILTESGREFFEGCVVFPLLDEEARVVSFYGRRINEIATSPSAPRNDNATTIHHPRSTNHLYLRGPHRGLFNGSALKLYPEIILTESVIDSLSVYQAGFKNTIPLYGLGGLTEDHLAGFKKYNTSKIILLMDGDEAGRNGALRLKERLEDLGTPCRIVNLSDGEDPNSFLKKHTREELEKILYPEIREGSLLTVNACPPALWRGERLTGNRKPVEDGFKVQYATRLYETRGLEQNSSRHLKANIKVISNHRFYIDTVDLYQARSRHHLVREVALFYNVEVEIIEQDIEKLIIECEDWIKQSSEACRRSSVKALKPEEEKEALELAKDPKLTERIIQDLETLGLVGESENKLLLYLAMSSRKMNDPLSVLILSGSGAGKSILQDKVLSLCPEEDLIKLTSLTKQALFYKDAFSMVHKVLAIEEEKGAEEANYPIRSLISAKKIVIESTIRDPYTGRMTTMTNEVLGPAAVIKSTTNPKQDAETKSRFLIVSLDESEGQTKKILSAQRSSETLEGLLKKNHQAKIGQRHQNFQRLLQPIEVVIPKGLELSWKMNALMARRDHPKYLALIKTIAFIQQYQRLIKEIEHQGRLLRLIEVEKSDLELANRLAEKLLSQSLQELSEPGLVLLKHLEKLRGAKVAEGLPAGKICFIRKEIRETLLWTDYQVRTYLKELVDLEYVLAISGRNGSLYRYKLLNEPPSEKVSV